MVQSSKQYYLLIVALFLVLLYFLSPILTPFLLGALLAYLANPLVKLLEKRKISHLLSVIIVFFALLTIILLAVLMLVPIISEQIKLFFEMLPQIIGWLQDSVMPQLIRLMNIESLKSTITSSLAKSGVIFSAVLNSGYALIGWVINLVLTPVVTFYLLCDWDRILSKIRCLLPRSLEPTIVKLAKESDEVLGAFFRGQLLVMLGLCLMYGVGLSLIGLKIGLILGIIGGLLSIVPYLGSIFVVVSASITALVQFGYWQSLLWVWGVFLIGQIIESYILTPYLVGERIGLHPIAVIFAIMAGGALFGFFGVLLALPVAAVLMVLLRFLCQRYFQSKLYKEAN